MALNLQSLDSIIKSVYSQQRIRDVIDRMSRPLFFFRGGPGLYYAKLKRPDITRPLYINRETVLAVEDWGNNRSIIYFKDECASALSDQGFELPLVVDAPPEKVFEALKNAPFWGISDE